MRNIERDALIMDITATTSLEEAKQFLRDNFGANNLKCPCCKQNVIRWKHKLNSQIAWCLIALYKKEKMGAEWVHVLEEVKPKNRMYSLGRWWKLIEPKPFTEDLDKPANGFWRITEKGKLFVERKITVPKHAFLFDNHCYGFSKEITTIDEALGNKFSYTELLQQ